MDAGTSVYPITFTNANGDITIYNINVTRNASSSASIAGFKVNGILNPDFINSKCFIIYAYITWLCNGNFSITKPSFSINK